MLILENATGCGIYKPEDLAFLEEVFAEACAADGAAKPDDIARKLLTLSKAEREIGNSCC